MTNVTNPALSPAAPGRDPAVPIEPLAPARLAFGAFVLETVPLRLSRDGVHVALQPQPARALVLLAARAGQVVTRETLRATLWGLEVHLDHEQAINFAIRRVRAALGDDAQHPTFIETIPRQGYRFVAPVAELPAEDRPAEVRPAQAPPAEELAGGRTERPPKVGWLGRRVWSIAWASMAIAAVGVLAVGLRPVTEVGDARPSGDVVGDLSPELEVRLLRGAHLIDQDDLSAIEHGIDDLRAVVHLAPRHAFARLALAQGYLRRGRGRPLAHFMPQVESEARAAADLGLPDVEAHALVAAARLFFHLDWQGAEAALERAAAIDPGNATMREVRGLYRLSIGQFEPAIADLHAALAADPVHSYASVDLAKAYFLAEAYPKAVRQARAYLQVDPRAAGVRWTMVESLLALGDGAAAMRTVREAAISEGRPAPATVDDERREIAARLRRRLAAGEPVRANLARFETGLGHHAVALDLLVEACAGAPDWHLPFIAVDPLLEPLRALSGWRELAPCLAPGSRAS